MTIATVAKATSAPMAVGPCVRDCERPRSVATLLELGDGESGHSQPAHACRLDVADRG
jgi:hypothetical protein